MFGLCTIPSLGVLFGFDQHSESVHLLPLQFIQLGPHMMADKVQLFGKLA